MAGVLLFSIHLLGQVASVIYGSNVLQKIVKCTRY